MEEVGNKKDMYDLTHFSKANTNSLNDGILIKIAKRGNEACGDVHSDISL